MALSQPGKELAKIFASITDEKEMRAFFCEIFTAKEIEDISLRWQLMKDLHAGKTQRSIAAEHRISLCKITRGSKQLKKQDSMALKMLNRHHGKKN